MTPKLNIAWRVNLSVLRKRKMTMTLATRVPEPMALANDAAGNIRASFHDSARFFVSVNSTAYRVRRSFDERSERRRGFLVGIQSYVVHPFPSSSFPSLSPVFHLHLAWKKDWGITRSREHEDRGRKGTQDRDIVIFRQKWHERKAEGS